MFLGPRIKKKSFPSRKCSTPVTKHILCAYCLGWTIGALSVSSENQMRFRWPQELHGSNFEGGEGLGSADDDVSEQKLEEGV